MKEYIYLLLVDSEGNNYLARAVKDEIKNFLDENSRRLQQQVLHQETRKKINDLEKAKLPSGVNEYEILSHCNDGCYAIKVKYKKNFIPLFFHSLYEILGRSIDFSENKESIRQESLEKFCAIFSLSEDQKINKENCEKEIKYNQVLKLLEKQISELLQQLPSSYADSKLNVTVKSSEFRNALSKLISPLNHMYRQSQQDDVFYFDLEKLKQSAREIMGKIEISPLEYNCNEYYDIATFVGCVVTMNELYFQPLSVFMDEFTSEFYRGLIQEEYEDFGNTKPKKLIKSNNN